MEIPLEIAFKNVEKSEAIENLIREKVSKLERLHDNIISCRIAVERPQKKQQSGNPYRVRIMLRIPPGRELVVTRDPMDNELHDPLDIVVRDAFEAAWRQLKRQVEQQQDEVKNHPDQETGGIIEELNRDDGFGFIRTLSGRNIYFHENSVLHDDFDRLEVGSGVRFVEQSGEKGPQASTVQLVDKPGVRRSE